MHSPDPRAALDALIAGNGAGYAALSRMLGRNAAYLQQYIHRGTPRVLAERDRALLAGYLGVDEQVLGAPLRVPPVAVRRLDVPAAAGHGGLEEEDRALSVLQVDPALLARLGVRADAISILRARGESMEPLIHDGDEIMVDGSDCRVGARGGVYVLRIEGRLVVKDVVREGRRLRISSRNPAFPALAEVAPDAVEVLGRVVWLSRALR